jgi:hypothetical protein
MSGGESQAARWVCGRRCRLALVGVPLAALSLAVTGTAPALAVSAWSAPVTVANADFEGFAGYA